jgi:hypothetical protein
MNNPYIPPFFFKKVHLFLMLINKQINYLTVLAFCLLISKRKRLGGGLSCDHLFSGLKI